MHKLSRNWTLWAHLPHDTKWTNDSYKKIHTVKNVEEIIELYNNLSENFINNCMLFLMQENIFPTWEDKENVEGGCFSYKVQNRNAAKTWKVLSLLVTGETSCYDDEIQKNINGITISPKKNFCIIKIWLKTCEHQDPYLIKKIESIVPEGCIFKKHV